MTMKSFNWNFKSAHPLGDSHVRSRMLECRAQRTGAFNVEDLRPSQVVRRQGCLLACTFG